MKSTHKGTCQACGRIQMLPSGKLSKHGYKVTHGFFSGVCRGADELPFEQDFSLVEKFVAHAKAALDGVEAEQKALRATPAAPTAWVSVYKGTDRRYGTSRHVTERATFSVKRTVAADGYASVSYSYTDAEGKEHAVESYSGVKLYEHPDWTDKQLLLETCRMYNERRANGTLEREAKMLRRYIKWQIERVRSWKPGELIPVNVKTKDAGFDADGA